MSDLIPTRIWLLILIAVIAFAPARYVVRHVSRSPSRQDITTPQDDLSWRSSGALIKNLAILTLLVALSVFIFTPAAENFAQSPSFMPILFVGMGGFALWTVIRGYMTGYIEPMVRGASWIFRRSEHPKRYWASMAWNGLLGGACLFGGGMLLVDAPWEALRDRCHDWKDVVSPADSLAACNRLLSEGDDDDRAATIAARGSAYYGLGQYRRAGADYASAISLNPDDSSFHYNLGLVHEQLGDRTRAAGDYNEAIRINPNDGDAYVQRGLIFLDTGRLDQAIKDFTRAHELDPAKVEPLANRSIAYAWKDDTASAERDFAAVRKTDPLNQEVLHGESILAYRRGDFDRAIGLLDTATARDPTDTWAVSFRASAHKRLYEYDKMNADLALLRQLERQASRAN